MVQADQKSHANLCASAEVQRMRVDDPLPGWPGAGGEASAGWLRVVLCDDRTVRPHGMDEHRVVPVQRARRCPVKRELQLPRHSAAGVS
jgi:hypothetical protein